MHRITDRVTDQITDRKNQIIHKIIGQKNKSKKALNILIKLEMLRDRPK